MPQAGRGAGMQLISKMTHISEQLSSQPFVDATPPVLR